MKKIIQIVIIPFFLSMQNDKSSTFKINSSPFETLNGNVKRLIETNQYYMNGKVNEYNDTTDFDKNGDPIITYLDSKMGNDRILKYETNYNKAGKKIESHIYSNAGETIYKYDSAARVVRSWVRNKNGTVAFQTTYKYDSKYRMIEQDYILSNDDPQQLFFKYDNSGYLIETDLFSKKHGLMDKSGFQYQSFDSKNNYIKRIHFSEFAGVLRTFRDTLISYRKITYY